MAPPQKLGPLLGPFSCGNLAHFTPVRPGLPRVKWRMSVQLQNTIVEPIDHKNHSSVTPLCRKNVSYPFIEQGMVLALKYIPYCLELWSSF